MTTSIGPTWFEQRSSSHMGHVRQIRNNSCKQNMNADLCFCLLKSQSKYLQQKTPHIKINELDRFLQFDNPQIYRFAVKLASKGRHYFQPLWCPTDSTGIACLAVSGKLKNLYATIFNAPSNSSHALLPFLILLTFTIHPTPTLYAPS